MPLLNSTIKRLNEITTTIENKNKLSIDDETMIKEIFHVQVKAYRKLGGSFWKMVQSLLKKGVAWFVSPQIRSYVRTIIRKKSL